MKKDYTIKQVAPTRWFYEFTEANAKGETLIIELSFCEDPDFKNSLPKFWYKNGFTDTVLKTYWVIQTYVTDKKGFCYGRYNPTHKIEQRGVDEEGKPILKRVINFDWMFEATEENKQKLIDEVYRLATL